MKTVFQWMSAAILVCGLCFVSCEKNNPTPEPVKPAPDAQADYTVMFYATGGENLDWQTEEDWKRACIGLASTPKVRFFIQYKYSTQEGLDSQNKKRFDGKYNFLGKAGHVYRTELKADMLTADQKNFKEFFNAGQDYGTQHEKSQMFQPDSIASYIKYCQKVAPAKHYIFMVSDHGAGFVTWDDFFKDGWGNQHPVVKGVCSDKYHKGNPDISIFELRQGIEKSGVHVQLVNFDDCLLNCIETAAELTGVADYMMASSHNTTGGNYTTLVKSLQKVADGGDFVAQMGDYMNAIIAEDYSPASEGDEVTKKFPGQKKMANFTLTDMAKLKEALPVVKTFIEKVQSEAAAGTLTAEKMDIAAQNAYTTTPDGALIDLMSYADQLKGQDANLAEEHTRLTAAMNAAIVKYSGTTALNAFFSKDSKNYLGGYEYDGSFGKLSYSVNLGSKMGNIVGMRASQVNDSGQIAVSDNKGKSWYYDLETKALSEYIDNEGKTVSDPLQDWNNSYYQCAFDKAVGWSKWFHVNTGVLTKNPPFMFE